MKIEAVANQAVSAGAMSALGVLLYHSASLPGYVTHAWASRESSPWAQGLPRFMCWFALGMGLSLVSAWQQQRGSDSRFSSAIARRSGLCWAPPGALFLLLGAITQVPLHGISFEPDLAMAQWFVCGVIALLIALPIAARGPASQLSNRLVSGRSVVRLGLSPYGIFPWQMGPLTVLFEDQWITNQRWIVWFGEVALIATAVTIPLAAANY